MIEVEDFVSVFQLQSILESYHKYSEIELVFLNNNNLYSLFNIFPANFEHVITLSLCNCKIMYLNDNTFETLISLKYLYLDDNHINILSGSLFIKNLNLHFLSLSKNKINHVFTGAISNMASIKTLSLEKNQLKQFRKHKSHTLKTLDLSLNLICKFDKNHFSNLKCLYLSNNLLKNIKKSMFRLCTQLNDLFLENNLITVIKDEAFMNLKSLQNLNFAQNKLKSISNYDFQSFENLVSLNLSKNRLENIADNVFKNLQLLRQLFLNDNKLKTLTSSLFQYNLNLEFLELSDNEFNDIDKDFLKSLSKLTDFILLNNRNDLVIETDFFANNFNLCVIKMTNSNIVEICNNSFLNLKLLENLFLDFNKLQSLPDNLLAKNSTMTVLKLNNNRLRRLKMSHFRDCDVFQLNLAENVNLVIDVNAFQNLTYLKVLNLSAISFQHQQFPDLRHLRHLYELKFNSCQMYQFPNDYFLNLSQIVDLDLGWNNIDSKIEHISTNFGLNYYFVSKFELRHLDKMKLKILKGPIFAPFGKLEFLTLCNCDIFSISSKVFENLILLLYIDLRSNSIEILENDLFVSLIHLQQLHLGFNKIANFSFDLLENNINLEILDLSYNSILNLNVDPVKKFKQIRYIFVDRKCQYSKSFLDNENVIIEV